jgi:hypothetical protein
VRIRAHGDFAGAPAGNFKVVVHKRAMRDSGRLDTDGNPYLEGYSVINETYSSPSTTPLSLNIPERAVNETFTVER